MTITGPWSDALAFLFVPESDTGKNKLSNTAGPLRPAALVEDYCFQIRGGKT